MLTEHNIRVHTTQGQLKPRIKLLSYYILYLIPILSSCLITFFKINLLLGTIRNPQYGRWLTHTYIICYTMENVLRSMSVWWKCSIAVIEESCNNKQKRWTSNEKIKKPWEIPRLIAVDKNHKSNIDDVWNLDTQQPFEYLYWALYLGTV